MLLLFFFFLSVASSCVRLLACGGERTQIEEPEQPSPRNKEKGKEGRTCVCVWTSGAGGRERENEWRRCVPARFGV